MSALATSIEANELPYKKELPKECSIEILDAERVGDVLVVLFDHNNSEASDPAFRNTRTGRTRVVRKQKDEALAQAAHFAVRLTPNGLEHACLLEQVPRISKARVASALSSLLKEDLDLARMRKKTTIYPKLQLDGVVSDGLREAMKNGRLNGVEFIRHGIVPGAGTGETPFVSTQYVQKFSIERKKRPTFAQLTKLFDANRKNFDEMRVRFTDADGVGKSASASTEQDAKDAIYIRTTVSKFDVALESAPSQIVSEIRDQMVEILDPDE